MGSIYKMSLRQQSAPKLQTQECQWQPRGSNSCCCKHPHPRVSGRRWLTVSSPCTSQRSCFYGVIHSFIHSTSICSLSPRPGRALGCRDESERGSLLGSHGHLVSSLLPQPSDLSPLSSGACPSASGSSRCGKSLSLGEGVSVPPAPHPSRNDCPFIPPPSGSCISFFQLL